MSIWSTREWNCKLLLVSMVMFVLVDRLNAERSRWMFGAKFTNTSEANLQGKIDLVKGLVAACPGYERAAYGLPIKDLSDDLNLVLYIDSENASATFAQAGCMVEVLHNNTELKDKILDGMEDATEVAVTIHDDSVEANESDSIAFAGFYRFRAHRDRLSKRFDKFITNKLLSKETTIKSSAFSGTLFPKKFLEQFSQDVHYGTFFSFGDWQDLLIFCRDIWTNFAARGNYFVPSFMVNYRRQVIFKPQTLV